MDLSDVLDHAEQLSTVGILKRLTADGRITWRPEGTDSSIAEFGSHRYRLVSVDKDGEPPYRLNISRREKTGPAVGYTPIASVSMRPVNDPRSNAEINGNLRELYEDAYRRSRRQASKIEEFMDELAGVERGDIASF